MASEVNEVFPFCKKIRNPIIQKVSTLLCGIILSPVILWRGCVRFTIPYVEIVVTPKCNLKCVGCSNFMPLYPSPEHSDIELIRSSIDALLRASHRITNMVFIGGEPFLRKDLHEIISLVSDNRKVKNIRITTNGTAVPSDQNLQCLKKPNITVSISKYGAADIKKFTDVLDINQIRYQLLDCSEWFDYGDTEKRDFDLKTLQRSYQMCASAECKTLLKGKFYSCPRAAHSNELGLIPSNAGDFIDIIDLLKTPERKPGKKLKAFYAAPYITACDYCTPVWERSPIPGGQQMKN